MLFHIKHEEHDILHLFHGQSILYILPLNEIEYAKMLTYESKLCYYLLSG